MSLLPPSAIDPSAYRTGIPGWPGTAHWPCRVKSSAPVPRLR